jgi:hypothetical protein
MIHVGEPDHEHHLPFIELNSTVEVFKVERADDPTARTTLKRWHVDFVPVRAGAPTQEGPRLHLQEGGHWVGLSDRATMLQMDEPRHLHPALDLILLSETVMANYYPDEWKAIRDDQTWMQIVRQSQELCFPAYAARFMDCLQGRPRSVLADCWTDRWEI